MNGDGHTFAVKYDDGTVEDKVRKKYIEVKRYMQYGHVYVRVCVRTACAACAACV